MKRHDRARIAQETLEIINAGFYTSPNGRWIDLAPLIRTSVDQTRLICPNEWPGIHRHIQPKDHSSQRATVEVTSESTLAALYRLIVNEGKERVAALNFASAKNPGGGFLGGSQAQEESLARSSALVASLGAAPDYYASNRKCDTLLYTDHAIYSPTVPVFRDDDGRLLEHPYVASFITMPAVNAGAIPKDSPDADRVASVMKHRIECVLALAASCGVFRNDPNRIASLFADVLREGSVWQHCFHQIVFAVYDTSSDGNNRQAFNLHFGT